MKQILTIILLALAYWLPAQIQLNNDEFDRPITINNWLNNNEVEGWNVTQLEDYNIGDTLAGNLFMMPLSTGWFAEYRGPFLYKEIAGDFILTTSLHVSARDGLSFPSSDYSLAGIMIRKPLNYPNQDPSIDWGPSEQNYIFMSIGRANQNDYSFEIKNTCGSRSCLNIVPAESNDALIRMIRKGDQIVILSKFGTNPWTIQNRYNRNGSMNGSLNNSIGNCGGLCNEPFPDTLQVGFVSYTDWPKVNSLTTGFHNTNTIHPDSLGVSDPSPGVAFNPDLRATFDFARFDSLFIPIEWLSFDYSDPLDISDVDIISQYGYDSESFCPKTISVTQFPISDKYILASSDSTISSNVLIDSTYDVRFSCNNEAVLNSGFEVSLGALFSLDQNGCQN